MAGRPLRRARMHNPTETIIARKSSCKCGCQGQDPWHKPTYKRAIHNVVEVAPVINYDSTPTETVVARGVAKMPWGEEEVVATRYTYNGKVLKTAQWKLANQRRNPSGIEGSTRAMAQREQNAFNSFAEYCKLHAKLNRKQAAYVWGLFLAAKVLKVDMVVGTWHVNNGQLLDPEVLRHALTLTVEDVAPRKRKVRNPGLTVEDLAYAPIGAILVTADGNLAFRKVSSKGWRRQKPVAGGQWADAVAASPGDDMRQFVGLIPMLARESFVLQTGLVRNPYKDKILLPSGNIQYVYSEEDVAKRQRQKAQRIEEFKGREEALVKAVKRDVAKGDDTALAIGLIMATYERPGNAESARDGHYGVTGWECRHLSKEGKNAVALDYIGKSGVQQHKVVSDPALVRALLARQRQCKRKGEKLLDTSPSSVNRYLADYGVRAKDLRTFGANIEMQAELARLRKSGPRLSTLKPRDLKRTLKAEFMAAVATVAGKLGHTTTMLRRQYLVKEMEPTYIASGRIVKAFA